MCRLVAQLSVPMNSFSHAQLFEFVQFAKFFNTSGKLVIADFPGVGCTHEYMNLERQQYVPSGRTTVNYAFP